MPVNMDKPIISESSLLEGYQLLVEDIDYSTVQTCTDVPKLVKILRILRSSQLGFYPHLTEFTEKRIRDLDPNHVMLKNESSNVWTKPELMAHGDSDFIRDLSAFCGGRNELDNSTVKLTPSNVTPIRSSEYTIDCCPVGLETSETRKGEASAAVSLPTAGKNRRIRSWDFAGWDKYDPESEIRKADLDAAEKEVARRTLKLPDAVDCAGLTEEEKERLAEREKEKGNEAYRAGDLDEAIVFYKRSISVIPSVTVINNRAQAYLKQEKYAEAASDCQCVLSLDPQNLKALLRLGTVLKKQRKYQEAGRQYELIRDIGLKENDPRLVQEMERNIREMGNLVGEEAGTPCFPYQPSQPRPKGPIIEVIE